MRCRFLLIVLLLCYGCTQPTDPGVTVITPSKKPDKQLEELKGRLDKIEKDTSRLRFDLDAEKSRYGSLVIDPSSKGYQRLDTSTGTFLVSLKDVQPYADGFKLKLTIGNPSYAQYNGFVLDVTWNKSFEKFTTEDWGHAQHEKTFNYTEKLMPGSWNTISLILSPAQKEELEFIEISMTTDQVMLMTR
jgi:hypothetical protein